MTLEPGQKAVLITGYVSRCAMVRCIVQTWALTLCNFSCTPGGIGHALALEFHAKGEFRLCRDVSVTYVIPLPRRVLTRAS